MHGLNEELGRHRGREGRKECLLCHAECGSVSHVLWDCPAYASIRSAFMLELRRELGDLSTFRVLIVLRSHLMS